MSIVKLLSEQLLLDLAGPGSFERGYDYFRRDLVESVDVVSETAIRAVVSGTTRYTTQLRASGDQVVGVCTCPVGVQGLFCKHAVATGLAVIAESGGDITEREAASQAKSTRQRTSPRRRNSSARAAGVSEVHSELQASMRLTGYLDWRQTTRWASRALAAIDAIEPLVSSSPDDAIALCEYALKRCDAVYGRIDDSGGELTMLTDRIEALHHDACTAARPDPIKLARRLYRLETRSGLDLVVGAYSRYEPVLGEDGRAEFCRLAELDWETLDGASTPEGLGSSEDWDRREQLRRVAAVLTQIAQRNRDVPRLVEVVGRQFAYAASYVHLANALIEIDALGDAFEWIQRGLARHPTDRALLILAVDSHHRRGEIDQAIEHAWTLFVAGERTTDYDRLLHLTDDDPARRRSLRDRALEHARERAASSGYADTYVELLLHDGQPVQALDATESWSCHVSTRLRVAAASEIEHPTRAAALYLDAAETRIQTANRRGYEQGIELLARADALLITDDDRAQFIDRIAGIRDGNRQKRSLIAMLDRRGW